MRADTKLKVHIGFMIKRFPVYLAAAIDEVGAANGVTSREEMLLTLLRTHPTLAKVIESQRMEAKRVMLRRGRLILKEGETNE